MININFAHIIGFGLIWFCINYKRTEKIESFTPDWFLTFIVLVVAVFLFEYKFKLRLNILKNRLVAETYLGDIVLKNI